MKHKLKQFLQIIWLKSILVANYNFITILVIWFESDGGQSFHYLEKKPDVDFNKWEILGVCITRQSHLTWLEMDQN